MRAAGLSTIQVVAVVVADGERAIELWRSAIRSATASRLRLGRTQRELLVGQPVVGFQQRFGVFEPVFDVEQQFASGGELRGVVRQRDRSALLRGDAQVGDDAAAHGVPVAEHRPAQVAVVERAEEIFIENRQRAPVFAERRPDGLLPVAGLVHVGIRDAVGRNQAVVAEIPVRSVIGVPVAAVAVDHRAVAAVLRSPWSTKSQMNPP